METFPAVFEAAALVETHIAAAPAAFPALAPVEMFSHHVQQ